MKKFVDLFFLVFLMFYFSYVVINELHLKDKKLVPCVIKKLYIVKNCKTLNLMSECHPSNSIYIPKIKFASYDNSWEKTVKITNKTFTSVNTTNIYLKNYIVKNTYQLQTKCPIGCGSNNQICILNIYYLIGFWFTLTIILFKIIYIEWTHNYRTKCLLFITSFVNIALPKNLKL